MRKGASNTFVYFELNPLPFSITVIILESTIKLFLYITLI